MRFLRFLLIGSVVLQSCVVSSCQESDENPLANVENTVEVNNGIVTVNPNEYYFAIRNPMKGFRDFFGPGYDAKRADYPYPFGSITKEYMQWNMLENVESDGVDKVIAYSNHRWQGVEDINMKVIPRIYVVWREPWHGGVAKNTHTNHPDDLNGWHWPSDIPGQVYSEDPNTPITGGYFHSTFQDRVKKLVAKAGEAWDNDPRVAYVEMAIVGEWGEHHDPSVTTYWAPHEQPNHVANRTWIPGIEKTLGDAFTEAFKNKKVMVRYAYDFKDYEFGVHWDSWSMAEEKVRGYDEMMKLGDRWKTQPMGGEITWDWGDLARYDSFEEVVANAQTRDLILDQIRALHCNHLGGVTWANFNNPSFVANAELLQKAMGYRFLLSNFSYPTTINTGESFKLSFEVTNTGSSPFYYDWPVEISILDAQTKNKVWSKVLESAKVSQWLPGDNWDATANRYTTAAQAYKVEEDITVTADLTGKYIIAISVLDPAGMKPSLRFAVNNYFRGGYHPMGYVGVNQSISGFEVPAGDFSDLRMDRTLRYEKTLSN